MAETSWLDTILGWFSSGDDAGTIAGTDALLSSDSSSLLGDTDFSFGYDNSGYTPSYDLLGGTDLSSLSSSTPTASSSNWWDTFTNGSSDNTSFNWRDVVNADTLKLGLGAYGAIAGKGEERKLAKEDAAAKLAIEKEMLERKFQMDKELLQMKLAAGSGGGGSSADRQIAYQRARDKYQGQLQTLQNGQAATSNSADLILKALAKLSEAGQAPLLRR